MSIGGDVVTVATGGTVFEGALVVAGTTTPREPRAELLADSFPGA